MKILKTILTFCILVLFVAGLDAYSEDDSYSGVSVFGPADSASAETYDEGYSASEELPDPGLMIIEIEGSRIGDIAVSQAVTLPMEGVISHVDTGVGHAFTIVRIDEEGIERQVYGLDSPGQAVGKKLPAGTYKVYPDNMNEGLEIGKMTTTVQVDFTEGMTEEGL